MWNFKLLRKSPAILAFFPFLSDYDTVSKDSETAKDVDTSKTNETGMDRLKQMFTLNADDAVSPEVQSILQIACMSAFVGGVYGGFMSTRTTYIDFLANNQATSFKTPLEAKSKLQDKMTISFGKGAFRWAWRLSLFSTIYMSAVTVISVYRGKFGIIEHVIGGATAGMAYKLPVGPRASVVGGILGSVLGLLSGSATYGILTFSGITMDDVRYWQYRWKESRDDTQRRFIQSRRDKEEVIILHDLKVGNERGLEAVDEG